MPYINVYLEKSAGLSGSQIGLITALSLILGFCVIPIWGVVGDETKKYNALLKFSIAGALVMVVLYGPLFASYAFLAVSIVHCLGVAIVTVGNLTYMRNSVNSEVLGTVITLFNATPTNNNSRHRKRRREKDRENHQSLQ